MILINSSHSHLAYLVAGRALTCLELIAYGDFFDSSVFMLVSLRMEKSMVIENPSIFICFSVVCPFDMRSRVITLVDDMLSATNNKHT